MLMNCSHPRPDLCARLGRHLWGGQLKVYLSGGEFMHQVDAEAPFKRGDAPPGAAPPGARTTPCEYFGELIQLNNAGRDPARNIHACSKHGKCTNAYFSNDQMACSLCQDYIAGKDVFVWKSINDLARDAVNLAGKLPLGLAGIAGIPRSGMLPAAAIATLLHLPLYQAHEDTGLNLLAHGGRGTTVHPSSKQIAVIDDTVFKGNAMMRLKKVLKGQPIVTAAVYATAGSEHCVDLYWEKVPQMHLLEWNCFNNGCVYQMSSSERRYGGIATDLDGILCHDTESGGTPGSPYLVARKLPIPMIITGRPEAHRKATEGWLHAHDVKFQSLHMMPGNVEQPYELIAMHKGNLFRTSKCSVFIESCPKQAPIIHAYSLKPVICPKTGEVYQDA